MKKESIITGNGVGPTGKLEFHSLPNNIHKNHLFLPDDPYVRKMSGGMIKVSFDITIVLVYEPANAPLVLTAHLAGVFHHYYNFIIIIICIVISFLSLLSLLLFLSFFIMFVIIVLITL